MTATAQQVEALAKANERRIAIADLKRRLYQGELTFREAIAEPAAERLVVWALLRHKRGIGHARLMDISAALSRQRVTLGYHTRIGTLTDRQRIALLELVEPTTTTPPARQRRGGVERKLHAPKPKRRSAKPKRKPTASAPGAVPDARMIEAVAAPPPRCSSCRIQMLEPSDSGICGFCEGEQLEAAA